MTRIEQLRRQRLIRHFAHRFVDNELLAAGGDLHRVFSQALAVLASAGFVLALMIVLRYYFVINELKPELRDWVIVGDQNFLVLSVMTLMGLFTVFGWDALFPDQRDAHVLGALPVPSAELFKAKLGAVVLVFGLAVAAMLAFPLLAAPPAQYRESIARATVVQLAVLSASAAFVFFGGMVLQGILLLLLPYRAFLALSSFFQIFVMVGNFALFFLSPNPALAASQKLEWVSWLPSYWYLSLWCELLGQPPPLGVAQGWLAAGLSIATPAAAFALFALGFRRAMRQAIEGAAPVARTGPGAAARLGKRLLDAVLIRRPAERAVFWFSARTMLRDRNHRLMLAVYGGLGVAFALSEIAGALEKDAGEWLRPNAWTCAVPLEIMLLVLVGMRALFPLPVALPSNWPFRMLAPNNDRALPAAVRKLMAVFGVAPIAVLSVPPLAALWGLRAALAHGAFLIVSGWLAVEVMLSQFQKIPFTCSWMPGQGNLKTRLGAYLIWISAIVSFFGALEAYALVRNEPVAYAWLAFWVLIPLGWYLYRRREFERLPWRPEFEGRNALELTVLGVLR